MQDKRHNNEQPIFPPIGNKAHSLTSSRSRRRKRNFPVICARALFISLFVAGFVCSILPWGRAWLRTTLLLPALITAQEPLPLQLIGEPLRHTQTSVPSRNGTVHLDIYTPATPAPLIAGARNGILILPGVGDQRQVPQLINLAQSLARNGIVAMTMTTPTLLSNQVAVEDSDAVVQAFQALSRLPGMEGQHFGIMSFSAGVPLACFAAADPRIRDQIAYIAAFGGYFNTESAIQAVGRRMLTIDGKLERWQPAPYAIQVLANVITKPLAYNEQASIRASFAPGGKPLSAQKVAHLSLGAHAIYQLLTGSEPERVEANMAALPPAVRMHLADLSPRRVISEIHAPIFLFHDRNDQFLPVTETRDFATTLTRIHHKHDYVEFHIFEHVEVKSHLDLTLLLNDGGRLFSAMHQMLLLGS